MAVAVTKDPTGTVTPVKVWLKEAFPVALVLIPVGQILFLYHDHQVCYRPS